LVLGAFNFLVFFSLSFFWGGDGGKFELKNWFLQKSRKNTHKFRPSLLVRRFFFLEPVAQDSSRQGYKQGAVKHQRRNDKRRLKSQQNKGTYVPCGSRFDDCFSGQPEPNKPLTNDRNQ